MLAALMAGQDDAETLAALARGLLRAKISQLQCALEELTRDHHRFLLQRLFVQWLWCKLESGVNGAFISLYWKEVPLLTRPERLARYLAWLLLVRPAC